jgi:hypothetical protein
VHALALGEPVAAHVGEGAAHEDCLLIPQHSSPAQTQELGAAQAAERGGEDRSGVVEVLLAPAASSSAVNGRSGTCTWRPVFEVRV